MSKMTYYNYCVEEKLYLNEQIEGSFNWIAGNRRFLWNQLVIEDKKRQNQKIKIMNNKQRNTFITKTIKANPFFKESNMARSTCTAVYFEYGRAWNSFFKDKKNNGKPKIKKSKTTKKSFSINNERNTIKIEVSQHKSETKDKSNYGYITIPKFKEKIKFRITFKTLKALENKDQLTKITIKESVKGDWYVVFHFRKPLIETLTYKKPEKVVGIDRNIEATVTTSDGDFYEADLKKLKEINNRIANLDKVLAEKRIVKKALNRKLKKTCKEKGIEFVKPNPSKRYLKILETRKKIFRKKTRIIKDFQNKTKKKIIEKQNCPTLFVLEKLNVKNMTKSAKGTKEKPVKNVKAKSGLNKAFLSVSPGAFGTMFMSDIERNYYQHTTMEVPAHNTSISCNECEYTDPENRNGHLFHCLCCGYIDHADINSTYRIGNKGVVCLKKQGVQVVHLNAFVFKKTFKRK